MTIKELLSQNIDAVEIHPLVGLDKDNGYVTAYKDAVAFDVTYESDPWVVGWGVYVHISGVGITNLFDVPTKEEAENAEEVLNVLLKLD